VLRGGVRWAKWRDGCGGLSGPVAGNPPPGRAVFVRGAGQASSTLTGSSLALAIGNRSPLHDFNDTSVMSAAWSASEQPTERPSRTPRIGSRGLLARRRTQKEEHDRSDLATARADFISDVSPC
jgi:hypothetical protein